MRIAVFDAVGTWRWAPTLPCIFGDLAARGAEIDVFLRLGHEGLESFRGLNARPFPVRFRAWAGETRNTLRIWKRFVAYKRRSRLMGAALPRYDLAIGVNPEGAIAAHRLNQATGAPFAYLSFEMMFKDELRLRSQQLEKDDEIAASRRAAVVISQDPWRARLLAEENGLCRSEISLLPVAAGDAGPPRRSNYLRARHGIGVGETVVLHSGSFGAFTCADELMDSLSSWPAGYALVVNTHYRPRPEDPYIARLKTLRLPHVHIGEGALSASEYETLVASADIGLALYRPSGIAPFGGKNIQTMGLSSGKLASYARSGLPVVAMGNPQIADLIGRYRFGACANAASEIPSLLKVVREDRDAFARGARTFFLDQLDFDRFWPAVWDRLSSVIEGRPALTSDSHAGCSQGSSWAGPSESSEGRAGRGGVHGRRRRRRPA